MADDIRVGQSDLLRQYSTQLQRFASSVTRGSKNIVDALEKEEEKALKLYKECDSILNDIKHKVDALVGKYEDAKARYRLDGMNASLLGTTDQEAKQKLMLLQTLIETQREKINSIKTKSQSLAERTKAFSSNMQDTSQRGVESLSRQADIIDDYKSAK